MIILILVLCVIAIFLYREYTHHKYWKYINEIPEPKGLPIIGHYELMNLGSEELFRLIRQRSKEFHPIYKTWSFEMYFIQLSGPPEDMELILGHSENNDKSFIYNFLNNWLGTGLLTSNGSKWHSRRKILTPAFHFNILQKYLEVFNKETEILLDELDKAAGKEYINVLKPITDFTLFSIGESALGVSLREKNCDEYKKAIHEYGKIGAYRIMKPILYLDFIFNMIPVGRTLKKYIKTLHDLSTNIIREREQSKQMDGEGNLSYSKRKRLALLDLMLEARAAGENIDEEGIREEVDTFMFEGHDTTSVALCYILLNLANEQEHQAKVYEEIQSVLGTTQYPTQQQLGELRFMERFVKECLRLYPSVPFISRKTGKTVHTHSGYTIPKNSTVFIHIYDLHHDATVWEDPERFDPDRFLPDNVAKRHPFAYLPFSAGGRNCIGQKFAMLEIKAVLCGILRKFKLESVDKREDIKFIADLVLRPTGEIRVKFSHRQ
ncbi:cytochrome P450 4C1-like [Diabrotica virgifera virgifera]|uniref:Cytochrome P450 4C1-like n=1 Tax=Diabrotica virgifera virgifera TaxID=50390 RepID=A0A6P7GZ40_DIAVI|nr:cytochrome P450 4C1-like [Diabrotica virgifera virgifera]